MVYQVVIIGGGVAGLTLGLKLARSNVDTLVVEKQSKASHLYKGELLQPKSLSHFDRLEILPLILDHCYVLPEIEFIEMNRENGRLLPQTNNVFSYEILDPPYNYACMIDHEKLKSIILKEAQSYPTFHYMNQAKFLSFKDEQTALVESGGEKQEIRGAIFVGAEGRGSRVAREMGVSYKEYAYNHQFLTVSFPRPPDLTKAEMFSWQNRFLGLFPLPDGRVRTVLLIKPGELKEMKNIGLSSFYEAYTDFLPSLKGYVDQIDSWNKIQLMIPFRHHASRYVKQNKILIGDAAHTVHPMAGEGMNMAIQDADILGELLVYLISGNNLTQKELLWYEEVRKPRAEFMMKLSHQAALFYSYPYDWFQKLRKRGIEKTGAFSHLHFKQMLNISGMGMLPFTIGDRLQQAGIPAPVKRKLKRSKKSYYFAQEEDYPWAYSSASGTGKKGKKR
ncbi:FAD-dependent oxidoreductase [Fictibacillus fluitans]|uniref:NAD(P)/FAD-dependent oxidoreductase n=1 Tax=Fictibacillus fluitans TaxID=3058422 RepID=A0ABT8HSK2_9BACL|nr:NAD(P)/FAD-dependent oxidoreductase [Fictibacillus sp. NE201]MDN4523714.1 NAD(P)/FAD-dependent oxidoreductase [Fictibacillus sp. NE201]